MHFITDFEPSDIDEQFFIRRFNYSLSCKMFNITRINITAYSKPKILLELFPKMLPLCFNIVFYTLPSPIYNKYSKLFRIIMHLGNGKVNELIRSFSHSER